MLRRTGSTIQEVVGSIPMCPFVLTAAWDDSRSGALTQWVQQCCGEPPMVMASVRKGHPVAPLIRDHRCFALCRLDPEDRALARRFSGELEPHDDPFVGLDVDSSPGGSPILCDAIAYLDCEMVRHVDIECEFELYVGLVQCADFVKPS